MKVKGKGGFKTFEFERLFKEMFAVENNTPETSVSSLGPMAYILNNHTLTPAKGGSRRKLSEWSDQTYFTHVLNGCLISGRILEKELMKRNQRKEILQESEKNFILWSKLQVTWCGK